MNEYLIFTDNDYYSEDFETDRDAELFAKRLVLNREAKEYKIFKIKSTYVLISKNF